MPERQGGNDEQNRDARCKSPAALYGGVRRSRCRRLRRRPGPAFAVQPVTTLGQRFDQGRVAFIASGLPQVPTQLVDAARHDVVTDHHPGPDLRQQFMAGNDLTACFASTTSTCITLGSSCSMPAGPIIRPAAGSTVKSPRRRLCMDSGSAVDVRRPSAGSQQADITRISAFDHGS